MAGEQLHLKASEAMRGGCRLIQYRDKSSNPSKRISEAGILKELCKQYSAKLIINDDINLAKQCGADGVHLGQGDGSPSQAREILGEQAIIGVTCHDSLELARQAVRDGASYIAFGRFFSSNTKPDALGAQLSLLTLAQAEFELPIVAIGGICRDNAALAISSGADSIAISHGLFAADDICTEASHLQSLYTAR